MCVCMGSLCWHQQGDPFFEGIIMRRREQVAVEMLAIEYSQLDQERMDLERRCRYLKRRQQALQQNIQEYIGVADLVDVPLVTRIGKFFITQIRKQRFVAAYECDFVEFRVVDGSANTGK